MDGALDLPSPSFYIPALSFLDGHCESIYLGHLDPLQRPPSLRSPDPYGELHHQGRGPIKVYKFQPEQEVIHAPRKNAFVPPYLGGHDGADYNLIEAFISAVANNEPSRIVTGPDDTLRSHLLVFHAERSRRENCVVEIKNDAV